ncbi:MAG: S-methyl-5-thioribose-1-phosphate isomerase [Bacteroidota bacterium]|nr:S-methyl-5-thioribose-1-phosphate isomerase [Bacteroidota bacterium]
MKINDCSYTTIWMHPDDPGCVQVIDQRKLPFEFKILNLRSVEEAYFAIHDMAVRGAPLIGITAAYGIYLSLYNYLGHQPLQEYLVRQADFLKLARPTAVNLAYIVDKMAEMLSGFEDAEMAKNEALRLAEQFKQEDIDACEQIGKNGLALIEEIYERKGGMPVNILTHCNAGWLACIDWGTATAPIFMAHKKDIPLHIWVDETRPRNQGARLTAWELLQEGISHSVIPDNTGGYLMQHDMVDLGIVGSDRTALNGDVANKIGTYLKALAAQDNKVPFYVALPSSSIDFEMKDGLKEMPIEERDAEEVRYVEGWDGKRIKSLLLMPEKSPVANYGFDVTPARLVTGLITERGICEASKEGILHLFPEREQ